MSALPPKSPAIAPFSDAFGYRVLGFDKKSGDKLEMLRLRPQLASSAAFEAALRERQRRLSDFRHPAFARVRQIDRPAGQSAALAVVSNHFEGVRLSELLKIVETHDIRLDLTTALCLLRQLAAATARLHECGDDISLGALNPERLVVAPNGRLVVTEYVLGAGLEALALPRQQVWQDYRVALPSAAAPARMDHAADIYQLGYVGLTLISGRSLYERAYPPALGERLQNAQGIALDGREQALPAAIQTWLARALWIDHVPFVSTAEAQATLDEAIAAAGLVASPDVVVQFLERCYAVSPDVRPKDSTAKDAAAGTTPAPAPEAPRADAAQAWTAPAAAGGWTSDAALEDAAAQNAAPAMDERETAPYPSPNPHDDVASLLVDAQTAARSDATEPAAAPAEPTRTEITLRPAFSAVAPIEDLPLPTPRTEAVTTDLPALQAPWSAPAAKTAEPAVSAKPEPREAAPEPTMFRGFGSAPAEPAPAGVAADAATPQVRKPYLVALGMALVMVAAIEIVLRFANPFAPAPASAVTPAASASHGTLAIDANVKAKVFIGDAARGETPVRLDLPAGTHKVRLEAEGVTRDFDVNIVGGKELSQHVELGRTAATTGSIDVKSDPAGARVSVDGRAVGASPVSVPDLKPGPHTVIVEGPQGAIRQTVQVAAGATASILVPLGAAPANAPAGGWLTVDAPEEMQVYEEGRLLGTSRSDRIMLPAGSHELELRNDAIGFATSRSVQVQGGKVARIAIQLPDGSLSLNAVPWAEVWLDGRRIGDTPVGNVPVRAGTHEIVFRHPQHGEVRQTVIVKAGEGGRVTVNMAK